MRSLLPTILLAALGELSLFAVFAWLDEPSDRLRAGDLAYFAVPFLLAVVTGALLARGLARMLRDEPGS